MKHALWLWMLLPVLTVTAANNDQTFGRDADALYPADFPEVTPIVLKALKSPTWVYGDKALSVPLKTFAEGDTVQLQAYTPRVYYVRNYKTNYEGWVAAGDISPINQEQLNNLFAYADWDKKVKDAIKKKEIIPGMTFDQVKAARGKPDTTSFRQDENGRVDKWSYVAYETRYQQQLAIDQFGRSYYQSVPYRVATGSFSVEFKNNYVTAVEKVQLPPAP